MLDQGIDTSTAIGRMFFQILGAIAEFEHALMSERTMDGLVAARARGRTGGQKPKLTPRQARIAQEMYDEAGPVGIGDRAGDIRGQLRLLDRQRAAGWGAWNGGISFGGVVAFIFADLIIIPIMVIYRKYYGTRMMLTILGVLYGAMVLAGYATEFLFGGLGWCPPTGPRRWPRKPSAGTTRPYSTSSSCCWQRRCWCSSSAPAGRPCSR